MLSNKAVVAMKRVMIVERRDLSSRATLEVQKRIAIGHRPSNLVNPRQIQMTFNGLSEGEARLHRVHFTIPHSMASMSEKSLMVQGKSVPSA